MSLFFMSCQRITIVYFIYLDNDVLFHKIGPVCLLCFPFLLFTLCTYRVIKQSPIDCWYRLILNIPGKWEIGGGIVV